jgi:tetratricopeptide (TPR) repeat protein
VSLNTAQPLPSVWNVPYVQNPRFTGRVDDLDRLRQGFTRRMPHWPIQAIHGLGGMGKTQLALQYVYQFSGEYDVVWWLRAEEPATLAGDLADLAVALRLHGSVAPAQPAAVEAVKQWLKRNHRWLLVFDSVREPHDLTPYLPSPVTGHILVTSRHASWSGAALPLQLRGLKRNDAAQLLLDRSGAGRDQEAPARELADALGDLPLALAQAGGYIDGAGISITEYLARFRARRAELMKRGAEGDSAPTVATTWDLAFRDAQARSPAAGELLALCSFLGADDIPRDALRLAAERFPPALAAAASDPFALDAAVKALRFYSLIEPHGDAPTGDALSIHRLVQAAVRDRLGEGERRAWAELAVAFVYDFFPEEPDDPVLRGVCRRWLPHARAALANARAAGVPAREGTEGLLRHVAKYYHALKYYDDAREMLEQALVTAEALHGPDHAHVAMALTGLGPVLMNLGRLAGALTHARRALAIDEANHGPDHAHVATDAINLASVLKDSNLLDEARHVAERALHIDQAIDPESADVARDANCLGGILRDLGDLQGARWCYERALAIDEKRRAPDLALRLNNLGHLLREMNELPEARQLAERALAIGNEVYGPEDPNVATFHSNLASLLQKLGLHQEAREHLEWALIIAESTYGEEHYAVAIRCNNLGLLLADLGDLRGALVELERAVEIARKTLGPGHRRVQRLENNRDIIRRRLSGGGSQPRG